MKTAAAPFLALLLAVAAPASAAGTAGPSAERLGALEQRLRQRPEDPTLWFYLARFRAQAGDTAGCVAALRKVQALGEGFLPARELGFAKVWADPGFQRERARLASALPRLDFAPTAFELADHRLLPEGIAYDAHGRTFYVGSVAEHKVVRVDAYNNATDFATSGAGLESVLGVAVDGPRRVLYAVSTNALSDEGRAHPHNAVFAFDMDTGRLLRQVLVPDAQQLNDVAVAFGGRVYASDSASGAVYRIPAGGGAPQAIVAPGALRGSNGLAPSPDGRRLYVAHATGIAVVDLADGAIAPLAVPPKQTVAAIDGLYAWRGGLVGVQNVTNPGRVIFMALSPDGAAVTHVQTLLSHHHPALEAPTTGAPTDDGFFLLAATGLDHLDRHGHVDRVDTLRAPTVLRVPLPR